MASVCKNDQGAVNECKADCTAKHGFLDMAQCRETCKTDSEASNNCRNDCVDKHGYLTSATCRDECKVDSESVAYCKSACTSQHGFLNKEACDAAVARAVAAVQCPSFNLTWSNERDALREQLLETMEQYSQDLQTWWIDAWSIEMDAQIQKQKALNDTWKVELQRVLTAALYNQSSTLNRTWTNTAVAAPNHLYDLWVRAWKELNETCVTEQDWYERENVLNETLELNAIDRVAQRETQLNSTHESACVFAIANRERELTRELTEKLNREWEAKVRERELLLNRTWREHGLENE